MFNNIGYTFAMLVLVAVLNTGCSDDSTSPADNTPLEPFTGTISENVTWRGTVRITDTVIISEGGSLVFKPGTDLEFEQGGLIVLGILDVQGTAGKPVTFTSAADEPAPGDWDGIEIKDTADGEQSRLEYAVIKYAGPGVTLRGVSPTISNTTFSQNYALRGAGMFIENATPLITGSSFIDNEAEDDGGAIYNNGAGASPTISNSTFRNNEAVYGGAIYNFEQNKPVISGSTFTGNTGRELGGALFNNQSAPKVYDSVFTGNSAREGGVVNNWTNDGAWLSGVLSQTTLR